jgi:Protein of unknown function (DUF3443)
MRRTASVGRAAVAALLVLASACGGGGGSGGGSGGGDTIGSPGPNVQAIAVNTGPAGDYVNGLFTSVTICVPGSSSCQTIDGVLVDTGSVGLRLVASVVTLPLPQQPSPGGAPLIECNQFQDSFQWGPVLLADVKLAGEQAGGVPIQLIGGTDIDVPDACSSSGVPPQHTVGELGANGILGLGLFRQDCGPACALSGSRNPGIYYSCSGSSCVPSAVGLDQQVQNPVWRFTQDNNGVIVQLPSVPSLGAPSVSGSLIFGIGTRSNNGLGSAQVYRTDDIGNITTVFQGQSYPASFVDSGSNGLYFLDSATSGLQACRENDSFYCPPTTASLTATNRGASGTSAAVNFTVANAVTLFGTPNNAFSNLGGTNAGAFDWGLPFFYGRNVYTAIELSTTPGGSGPYFAY